MEASRIFMDEIEKISASFRSLGITDPKVRKTMAERIRMMFRGEAPLEVVPPGASRAWMRGMVAKVKEGLASGALKPEKAVY